MKFNRSALTGFAAALFVTVTGAHIASAQMMPLAAHKAVYELKMLKSSGGRALTDARTIISVDFSGSACEGYAMNFRQAMELTPAEGPVRVSEMRSVTFEDGEGANFRFRVNSSLDGQTNDDLDGRATRSPDGAISVQLDRPGGKKSDLADTAIFPTDHIRRIISAARSGETTLAARVFDGSDTGVKMFDTLTILGKPLTGGALEAAAQAPELASMTRWPVTISYFTLGKKEDAPDYVISFDLYENGIARALRLDYGDFVLGGDMSKLEILPTATCGK